MSQNMHTAGPDTSGSTSTTISGAGAHVDADVQPPTRKSLTGVAIGTIVLLGALAAAGIIPRLHAAAEEKNDAARVASEPAHVVAVHPDKAGSAGDLLLPGSIEAFQEAVVYARTNGYVRKYFVDIGDSVKEGQLLATIDTPEVDQELRQAQASAAQAQAMVVQAKTQRELAETTVKRYATLAPSGVASQQELDEKQAGFDAQQANLQAANAAEGSSQANVRRLADMKSFSQVTAPFDGVITSRTTENGQLVSAGNMNGQALFKVAQLNVVRVFLRVPQIYAPSVQVGSTAKITVREFPGRVFTGKVSRTARALDPAARTLLTQVDVPNGDGALLAGMYTNVALDVKRSGQTLLVPSTALLANEEGTRVATVTDGKILWKTVVIESDMGDKMSIAGGLSENDMVVIVPSSRLVDGLKVEAVAPPVIAGPTPAAPPGPPATSTAPTASPASKP